MRVLPLLLLATACAGQDATTDTAVDTGGDSACRTTSTRIVLVAGTDLPAGTAVFIRDGQFPLVTRDAESPCPWGITSTQAERGDSVLVWLNLGSGRGEM